jgi:ribosomal protein S18 acetylase RimI-like enzyme
MKEEYKIEFRIPLKQWNDNFYEIQHFVFPENYRGRGIGTELLKKLTNDADDEEVTLCVKPVDSKDDYVIHLYEKHGFKHVGNGKYIRVPNKALFE